MFVDAETGEEQMDDPRLDALGVDIRPFKEQLENKQAMVDNSLGEAYREEE